MQLPSKQSIAGTSPAVPVNFYKFMLKYNLKAPKHIQLTEMDAKKYVFGGMEVHSTNILRLISELEGSYSHLKYMGFEEDMNTLDEIKQRYYKMYYRLAKQEKSMLE